ncbi:MAG: ribonuclease P protein component [Campylobacteraceae bacterium]|nr:ribonuclease P protein component [Campylobacteraceae bacterium]
MSETKEFKKVYDKAKKWHSQSAIVYFLADDEKKFAVVASKKIGKAVQRNRAKRLIRAVFIDIKDDLKPGSYIIITKAAINELDFATINKNLRWSFRKLEAFK